MVRPIDAQRLDPRTTAAPAQLSLSGVRVLVVEDDYYLAMEAKAVLEGAGAQVIGPVSSFEQLQRALSDQRPDCAVVDINLGEGPSFAAAQRLEADGVPFVFLTGYSADAVPEAFKHISQMQKPSKTDALVSAVRRLPI
jgi:CheY-like chemotaxis protein